MKLKKYTKKEWKEAFSAKLLFSRTNQIIYLLVILFWFGGFFMASQWYQLQCNEHIIREFYPEYVDEEGNIDIYKQEPLFTDEGYINLTKDSNMSMWYTDNATRPDKYTIE